MNSNAIFSLIKIIYEDKDILVIDKPAGLVVHADGKTEEPTLVDWILEKYPKIKGVGENIETTGGLTIERPGIVHRLDRGTSGLLVIAKTKKAHAFLKEQFQNRELTKKYLAFVHGELKREFEMINRPITRSKTDFRRWTAQRGGRGEERDAETWYERVYADKDVSLALVQPKTGRTHQIRVHMKAINHPVVGDTLYAPNQPKILGFDRTALHAYCIEFTLLPKRGKEQGELIKLKAPWPEDFDHAIKQLGINIAKIDALC